MRLAAVLRAPHPFEERVVRHRFAGVRGELGQEVELGRREMDLPLRHEDAPRAHVDAEIAELEAAASPCGGPRAPEHRLDARDELARAEWLGHVVIGAELQAAVLVLLEAARRQHDHRQVALRADLLEDGEAIVARHREIEHDQVRLSAADDAKRLLPIGRLDRLEILARILERAAHERTDVGLVVDDEDFQSAFAGTVMTNVAPPPGVSSYFSVPPCSSVSDRAIARPSPAPAKASARRLR